MYLDLRPTPLKNVMNIHPQLFEDLVKRDRQICKANQPTCKGENISLLVEVMRTMHKGQNEPQLWWSKNIMHNKCAGFKTMQNYLLWLTLFSNLFLIKTFNTHEWLLASYSCNRQWQTLFIWHHHYRLQNNTVTHVKSCSMTREGLNGISTDMSRVRDQSKMFSTSFCWTWKSSQFRTADSNKTRMEYGRLSKTVVQYFAILLINKHQK